MRMVDLIQRKRDGEELSAEEIAAVVFGYGRGEIPDYQTAALLMAIYFQGMSDDEATAFANSLIQTGEVLDLSGVKGPKVGKQSTGGVGDKTSLVAAPLAAAAGVKVAMVASRALGFAGGTRDKLESIPGFRVELGTAEITQLLNSVGLCFFAPLAAVAPAEERFSALRELTATLDSVPLLASSLMAKQLGHGIDALVADVKVGAGAFVKRQLEGRRLAQYMSTIARRAEKKFQALVTDMNQPLGFAIGNALEVMEVSQTLQGVGPEDLTRLSVELAARMIFLGGKAATLDEARELAQLKLVDLSGYKKLKQVIQAQGGDPQVLDRFELLPTAMGFIEIKTPRTGYVTAIDAGEIGRAACLIGAGRETRDGVIDPGVGIVLDVKVGARVESGSTLCRIYYTNPDRLEEASQVIEGAFRISSQEPEQRDLILEVIG